MSRFGTLPALINPGGFSDWIRGVDADAALKIAIDVRDHGAVVGGNAATNRAAVQAAFDAANGAVVEFPPVGLFDIDDEVVVPSNGTTVRGHSREGAVSGLRASATMRSLLRISGTRGSVANIELDGNNLATSSLLVHSAARGFFVQVNGHSALTDGCLIDENAETPRGNNNLAFFVNCRFSENGGCGFRVAQSPFPVDANGIFILNPDCLTNGSHGVLYRGQGFNLQGGVFDNNGGYGIQLGEAADTGTTFGGTIQFPWLENNALGGVHGGKSVRNRIELSADVQGYTPTTGVRDGTLILSTSSPNPQFTFNGDIGAHTAALERATFQTDGSNQFRWIIGAIASGWLALQDVTQGHDVIGVNPTTGEFRVVQELRVMGKAGFFGATPITKPAVTGSTADEKVDSLISALATLGLVTDNTT